VTQATPSLLTVYQPLIVGLGAVVLGLIANTILEWFRQTIAANHKRAVLRRALVAELEFALGTAKVNFRSLTDDPPLPNQFLQMPVREVYPAYERALNDLGLLSKDEISPIIDAYEYLLAWPEIILMIGKLERVEGRLFASVPAANSMIVTRAVEDRIGFLNRAIEAVKRKTF